MSLPSSLAQGLPKSQLMQQRLGIGTFVTLDYNTGLNSRNEYAVMLLSDNWASLRDLLYDPQAFIAAWQNRYLSTPKMRFGVGTALTNVQDWRVIGPVTIQIEPLTVPSPGNLVLLSGLTSMYPLLKKVLTPEGLSSPEFAVNVRRALEDPIKVTPDTTPFKVDPEASTSPRQAAKNISQFKGKPTRRKHFIAAEVKSCSTVPPAGPLAYIVEFAVLTRIMTIKYVPRSAETKPRWFQTLDAYEASRGNTSNPGRNDFTGINLNNVAGTDLTFMHFDITFAEDRPKRHTHDDVSRRRADFVMSFLEKPDFFTTMNRPDDIATLATLKPDDVSHDLEQPGFISPYPVTGVQLYKNQLGPTVTIDSVYSPSDPQISKDSAPFICVVGQTTPILNSSGIAIGWNIGGVIVKSYMAPVPSDANTASQTTKPSQGRG